MRAALLLYINIIIFASCNNDYNTDGGPCAYDEKVFPATLTRLEKIDSLHYDALFIIKDSSGLDGKDSIRYSILNNGYYITAEEVMSDSISLVKDTSISHKLSDQAPATQILICCY